ncbi:GAF domain-containing protein [Neorhizobium sp. NPDC001467]|uniref:GAF domain-containing protein n=1 Tax=Neorhizobium sp. NPDC001467 TaxID=3390595 RepID=UPI003D012AA2
MPNRSKRIRAVRNAGLFEPHHRSEFDDIVETVKKALRCPVAIVSILDEDRQVFAAHVGLPTGWAERGETPLTHSFCQHVVDDRKPFVVDDATMHQRVRDNLAIRDLGVISYMGVPVSLPDGTIIGAVAAIDGRPREWSQAELDLLTQFGKLASNHIANLISDRRWSHLFQRLEEGIIQGTVIRDAAGTVVDWRYDQVNPAWAELVGVPVELATGNTIRNVFPGIEDDWIADAAMVVETGTSKRFTRRVGTIDRWFDGYVQATGDDTFVIMFLEVTDRVAAAEALRRSEEQLRLLVEGAKDYAILTVDLDGKIAAWFGGAQETFGRSEAEMLGRPFAEIFTTEDRERDVPANELATAAREGVSVDRRWHARADGSRVFLDGTVRPLLSGSGGEIRGYIKIARNATLEKQSQDRQLAFLKLGDRIRELHTVTEVAFAASETMAQNLVGATRAGYGVVDPIAETVQMLPGWCAPKIAPIAGLHHFREYGSFIDDLKRGENIIIPDVALDPRTAASADMFGRIAVATLVNLPIMEHGVFVGVMFVHYDKPHEFTAEERDFVRTVADRTREAVSRIRAQEDQQILNHEIGHRLKNTMAMVQAIATQTLRPVTDRGPVEAFTSRLHALSKAHEVLLGQDWSSARIVQVTDSVLNQLALPDRYRIEGPDLELGPRTALSLALLMHELGTNALKYGAWSCDTGIVSVSWKTEAANGDSTLVLTWTETNGPPVAAPSGKGFGSRLIRLGLMGTGGVEISYDPSGLKVEMRGLVSQLRQS